MNILYTRETTGSVDAVGKRLEVAIVGMIDDAATVEVEK